MFNDPDSSPLGVAHQATPGPAAAPQRPLRVGLIGLGTVGGGTWRVLRRNQALLRERAGRGIEIVAVCARDLARAARTVQDDPAVELVADPLQLAARPGIDVLVEAAGGTDPAREWVLRAIAHGKHVVTANKALLAVHGEEIFAAARRQGVAVAYEAAVAASIPIVKALREGLAGNRIHGFTGIVNGTTNFILSRMRSEGLGFAEALAQAQALGYAEADPAFDIHGIDAAHKAALLAAEAFGAPVRFDDLQPEGIAQVQAFDLACAERLGLRLKLLALARCTPAGIELRVHPALLPAQHLLAQAEGTMNGIVVDSDAAGPTLYFGAGAGAEQTASAVLADLVDVARLQGRAAQHPGAAHERAALPLVALEDIHTHHYFRVPVLPQARLQAAALRVLDDCGVPLRSLSLQHDAAGSAHLVLLTHAARDGDAACALQALAALPGVAAPPVRLRVELLD